MTEAAQTISEALSRCYGETPASIEPILPGRANDSFRVSWADGQQGVARVYGTRYVPERKVPSIAFEHTALHGLHGLGLPVAPPLPFLEPDEATRSRTIGLLPNGEYLACFRYLTGTQVASNDPRLISFTAHTLATIHRMSKAVELPVQRPAFGSNATLDWVAPPHTPREWFWLVSESAAGHDVPWERIADQLDHVADTLQRLRPDRHPQVLIHSDVRDENLLTDGQTITGILDFDHCQMDSPIVDIAFSAYYVCRVVDNEWRFDADRIARLVELYQREAALPEDIFECFWHFLCVSLLRLLIWSARLAVNSADTRAIERLRFAFGSRRFGLLLGSRTLIERAVLEGVREARVRDR